jgi:hypothetical protein
VFEELLTMMPFLRDSDIVDEMVNRYVALFAFPCMFPSADITPARRFLRISDIPSKQHICDGLEAFHGFVKSEIYKEQAKLERRRRKEGKAKRSARGTQAPTSTSRTSRTPAAPTNSGPSSQPLTGFDDVD